MARFSSELLAQARLLARREPRRPKQASLRRSISASYYALFHFLIEETTRLTMGAAHGRTSLRQFAGRAFVHGKMKDVCAEFTKSTPRNDALKPFWPNLHVREMLTSGRLLKLSSNFKRVAMTLITTCHGILRVRKQQPQQIKQMTRLVHGLISSGTTSR
jgi:hypothetical protein